MSLTRADVERIARLAQIDLSNEEIEATLGQMQSIFELIGKMQAVNTEGIEPLATPLAAISEVTLRLREDAVTEIDQHERLLALAPASADGLFLVPQVIEQ
jgi:aspartyl-tRNA(Asn)/glutamyl-tRNA(Gln) amidotransferase subunit C